MSKFPTFLTCITLSFMLIAACASSPHSDAKASSIETSSAPGRGTIIKLEYLQDADQARLQEIADDFPGDISVQNGAELFRLTYSTVFKGEAVIASGLLSLPVSDNQPKGVFLFFHGSNFARETAPSQPDRVDGNEETAIFAGNGYYVILPDYIGLGASERAQSFLVTKPDVDASQDLLIAARQAITEMQKPWPRSLYMMGFSQGGHLVAGMHRSLEQNPVADLEIRASVGVAGVYDIRGNAVLVSKETECFLCTGFLAGVTASYSDYYDVPLEDTVFPEYSGVISRIFDGTMSTEEIFSALPGDLPKLFKPKFLAQVQSDQENWLTKALDENETFAWTPVAPFRLYYGENDINVRPAAAKAFYEYAKPRGGNISIESFGPVDHQTTSSISYAPTLEWFNQLSEGK